jgi:hypothetical protein
MCPFSFVTAGRDGQIAVPIQFYFVSLGLRSSAAEFMQ